jgi:hypothetical protein
VPLQRVFPLNAKSPPGGQVAATGFGRTKPKNYSPHQLITQKAIDGITTPPPSVPGRGDGLSGASTEDAANAKAVIADGAMEAVHPVLMTVLVTSLGFVPMATAAGMRSLGYAVNDKQVLADREVRIPFDTYHCVDSCYGCSLDRSPNDDKDHR